jgi:hypothetical protein
MLGDSLPWASTSTSDTLTTNQDVHGEEAETVATLLVSLRRAEVTKTNRRQLNAFQMLALKLCQIILIYERYFILKPSLVTSHFPADLRNIDVQ